MNKIFISLPIVFTLLFSDISCKKEESLPTQIPYSEIHTYEEALLRWKSFNYHDYILYQLYDGWSPGVSGPVRLLVLSDTIAEIKLISNDSLLSSSWQRFQTVDQLFDQINIYHNMDTSRYIFNVEYDLKYGYPTRWHVYIKPPQLILV